MTNRKAKRKINSFNFEGLGSHVALVDKAANEQSVLIMKSAKASDEEIRKALDKDITVKLNIMDFLCRYLDLYCSDAEIVAGMLGYTADQLYNDDYEPYDFIQRIQSNMDSVVINKSLEDSKLVTNFENFKTKYGIEVDIEKNQEDSNPMADKNANTDVTKETQADIEKAAQQASELVELRKAHEQQAEELRILKAAEDKRSMEVYMTKAAAHMPNIPETAGVSQADLSVAIRKMEADPEMASLATLIESYSTVLEKSQALDEKGTSVTEDQDGFDNQVVRLAKSLKDSDSSLTDRQAEMRAFEQLSSK